MRVAIVTPSKDPTAPLHVAMGTVSLINVTGVSTVAVIWAEGLAVATILVIAGSATAHLDRVAKLSIRALSSAPIKTVIARFTSVPILATPAATEAIVGLHETSIRSLCVKPTSMTFLRAAIRGSYQGSAQP